MPSTSAPQRASLASEYALIYTRVSSGRQVENASLETQERICTEFCERNGWRVLKAMTFACC
jgi:DNA invertase Pin-like site-specific DNA recombinase